MTLQGPDGIGHSDLDDALLDFAALTKTKLISCSRQISE